MSLEIIKQLITEGDHKGALKLLKDKTGCVPEWSVLVKDYDTNKHDIIADPMLRPKDKKKKNYTEKAARITYAAEKIATRRMGQMCFTIPVQRTYDYDKNNEVQKKIAEAIEKVYETVRINGVNSNRMRAYFAACEVCTIWYNDERNESHSVYGFETKHKLRCRSYSPMNGQMSHISEAKLYPLFDEYDDMIAMSIEYSRKNGTKTETYLECYTSDTVYKWRESDGETEQLPTTKVAIGKIQCVYLNRTEPIYAEVGNNRNEIEFATSRQSDIIRKNSAPIVTVVGDFQNDKEKPTADQAREVYHLKNGGAVNTTSSAISPDNTKYFVGQLKSQIEEVTQLPNLSLENIKGISAISGEARKTLLTDAHMKVGEESHDMVWAFDRESNIIKAFLKQMNKAWKDEVDKVGVKHHIIPFVQNDEALKSKKLLDETAGGIKSKLTAITELGAVKDVAAEIAQIAKEAKEAATNRAIIDVFNTGV